MASQPVEAVDNNRGYSIQARREIIEHVVEELSKGERGLSKILNEDEGMPSPSMFYRWMLDDDQLSGEVERAREIAATKLLDEIVDIADDATSDVEMVPDKHGKLWPKINGDSVQRAKLRIYARQMFAEKIAPKRFGNKVDVTSDGKELKPAQLNDNRLQSLIQIAATRKAEDMKKLEGETDEG